MAMGARYVIGSTVGISTTGNAGPNASEGKEVGEVYIAVAKDGVIKSEKLGLIGNRNGIRLQTTHAVLKLLLSLYTE